MSAMTDHAPRLYALALAILGFFVVWAVVAAHPWASSTATGTAPAPIVARLTAYEKRLLRDTALVDTLVRRNADRAAAVRAASAKLASRSPVAPAAAPVVTPAAPRIVYLPPITVTRTS